MNDGQREPNQIQKMREIEELEAARAAHEGERARPHHGEHEQQQKASLAYSGSDEELGESLLGVAARIGERETPGVAQRQDEQRVPQQAMKRDRVVDR